MVRRLKRDLWLSERRMSGGMWGAVYGSDIEGSSVSSEYHILSSRERD